MCNAAAIIQQKFGRQIVDSGTMRAYELAGNDYLKANFLPSNWRAFQPEPGFLGSAPVVSVPAVISVVPNKGYRGILPLEQMPLIDAPQPYNVPVRV